MLEAIKERGEIVTKVAYGDWKRGDYGRAMSNHAVRLVQRVMTPGGDKNGADINLALDALEMAFTHDHINAFVIVGGDSDFITLVEKLKQYDRKVFVVGGRAFTSQVMQKNCTEFIAYENMAGRGAAAPPRARRRATRPARCGQAKNDRPARAARKPALKLLADREVTPQLGLLKSTLLQLDSSFSERDYGCSSFRDFAEKLAEHGLVSLKHQGRSTLVELVEGAGDIIAASEPLPIAADLPMDGASAPIIDATIVLGRVRAGRRRRAATARSPTTTAAAAAPPMRSRSAKAWRSCAAAGRGRHSRRAGRCTRASSSSSSGPAHPSSTNGKYGSIVGADARLPEGRAHQARTRSTGRPARVRRRRRHAARVGAARLVDPRRRTAVHRRPTERVRAPSRTRSSRSSRRTATICPMTTSAIASAVARWT